MNASYFNLSLFKEDGVLLRFHSLANVGRRPSEEDWEELLRLFEQEQPAFRDFLMSHQHSLNDTELKTCMLARIHINPRAIGNMLGVSGAYISKIRGKMVRKVFNDGGGLKRFDRLIADIGSLPLAPSKRGVDGFSLMDGP